MANKSKTSRQKSKKAGKDHKAGQQIGLDGMIDSLVRAGWGHDNSTSFPNLNQVFYMLTAVGGECRMEMSALCQGHL